MARRGPRLLDSPLDFAADIRILDDSLPSTPSSGEAQDTDTQRVSEGEYGEYIPLSPSPASGEAQDTDTQRVSEGEYGEYIPLSPSPSSGEAQDSDTQRVSEGEYGEYIPLSPSPASHEVQYPDDSEEEGEYPPYLPVGDEEVSDYTDNSSDWNDSEEWGDWSSGDSGYDTMDERDDFPLIRELPPGWRDWLNPFASGDAPFAMPHFGHANDPLFPRVVVPVAYPLPPPSAAPSSPALLSTPSAASSPAPSPPPSAASSSPALLFSPSAASSPAPSPPPSAASSSPALLSSPSAASSPAPSAPPSAAPSSATLSASPSTSALTSSAKRSRDDICTEEVSAKRSKVSDTFDAPSTSSGSFGVRRFWERPFSLSLDDSDSD
ncbi:protein NDRG1 [Sarotherodon galilaeus]